MQNECFTMSLGAGEPTSEVYITSPAKSLALLTVHYN